jgi:hypothetical protein
VSYQLVWFAWAALLALTIGLAFAVMRWQSVSAGHALSFILGVLFGQILVMLAVGVPRFLAVAFTEGAGAEAGTIGLVVAYMVGAVAVGATGVALARNPLITPSWWFVAGAVANNAVGAARTVAEWTSQDPASSYLGLVLNLALGAALIGGYWLGRRSRSPVH